MFIIILKTESHTQLTTAVFLLELLKSEAPHPRRLWKNSGSPEAHSTRRGIRRRPTRWGHGWTTAYRVGGKLSTADLLLVRPPWWKNRLCLARGWSQTLLEALLPEDFLQEPPQGFKLLVQPVEDSFLRGVQPPF